MKIVWRKVAIVAAKGIVIGLTCAVLYFIISNVFGVTEAYSSVLLYTIMATTTLVQQFVYKKHTVVIQTVFLLVFTFACSDIDRILNPGSELTSVTEYFLSAIGFKYLLPVGLFFIAALNAKKIVSGINKLVQKNEKK
jgi:hypothetical protein